MKIFYSNTHRAHEPQVELMAGQFGPALDVAERVDVVTQALTSRRLGELLEAPGADWQDLRSVHTEEYLRFLQSAWSRWNTSPDERRPGLPFVWPHRNRPARRPESIEGQLGYYMFDGISPITSGMWTATVGAAGVALAAARAVLESSAASMALCRPPGHHAGIDLTGGSSYVNNTALAAAQLASAGARVAILDVDVHHGNGTQDIFWRRNDVLTISIHCDPACEYPYFSGYADEVGAASGEGFNLNLPLSPGAAWREYSAALEVAGRRVRQFAPDFLVVALGVDSYCKDPTGKFQLELLDFARVGEVIYGMPGAHVFVLEGGYHLQDMGDCIANVLESSA
jgi:acetoin utilization deacetylase AcuC-like enzyme